MNQRSTLGGGALLALALLFIGLTLLFNHALRGWRLDLTQNRLYTTAPGTDRILASIKEPINLYFFYSEKAAQQLPQLKPYGTRVREFLEELTARSNGKLRLHVIDPQPFSEEEDRAAELGVHGAPLGGSGGQFYFGLAGTNATDGHAAIEFFDPNKEQFLEYDVIKLVYQLANPKKPVVSWLSTLPMQGGFDPQGGGGREPWVVYSEAQQLFDLKPLAPNATQIDPATSVLVLVHPKNLAPATQFAIDQYALRGGHVLVFVDPLSENDNSGAEPGNPVAAMTADKASQFSEQLKAWGVAFDPGQVVADRGRALSVTMRQGEDPVLHLGVLGLNKDSFSADDVITSGLSVVNVALAGALAPVKDAKVRFEPLLQSSTDAELLPVARFRMLMDPAGLLDGFKPSGQRYTLAARVSGMVHTAF
ncbi:MAG TPA: Gldg family protein, partial [Steroidobacteraceae bacterium]|nr:Gldg family protein [Steroidobacteraceae bacterium]